MPHSPALCELEFVLQAMVHDPFARGGVAFSRALVTRLGAPGSGPILPGFVVPVGDYPTDVTAADLDSDGALDLVTAERNSNSGAATVALGDGWGRFAAFGQFTTTSTFAHDVEASDLDGDGHPDAVLATNDSVWTLIGSGDGSLFPFAPTPASFPIDTGLSDLNHDGVVDLVVLENASETVLGLLGEGDGTFAAASSIAVGDDPVKLDVGDIDGDGRTDVLVANRASGSVSILLGQGNGGFVAAPSIAAKQAEDVVLDYVDSDGVLDALIVSEDSVDVHHGLGDGRFQLRTKVAVSRPYDLASGHLGLQGGHGFVVASAGVRLLAYQMSGESPYALETKLATNGIPYSPILVDLDSDGLADLAAALNSGVGRGDVAVFLGEKTRVLGGGNSVEPEGLFFSNWADAGDFNSDSILDLAVVNLSNSLGFLLGSEDGSFRLGAKVAVGTNPFAVAVADLDLDRHDDVLLLDYSEGRVYVLLGDGQVSFELIGAFPSGTNPTAILATDLTRDGVPDAVVIDDSFVRTFVGGGNGTFSNRPPRQTGNFPTGVVAGDWNGDGIQDLAVSTTSTFSSNVVVYLGVGNGAIGLPAFFTAGASASHGISSGDMDRDGDADLVVGSGVGSRDTVVVLLGNGDGNFSFGAAYPILTGIRSLRAADLDADGNLDVLVSGIASSVSRSHISLLLGTGDGSLAPAEAFIGGESASLLVRDLDGDGLLDVVASNHGQRFYTLFNRLP